jgi:TetR/AcrR family transcriptional regulator, cholesterol catabolism regulator
LPLTAYRLLLTAVRGTAETLFGTFVSVIYIWQKTERVLEEKEKHLLFKVRELMFKLGIKSLSMDDIARQLGISKKTIYQHFENKADLVEKVMELTLEEQKEENEKIIVKDGNAIDQLLKMYMLNSRMMEKINPSLIFEMGKYYPETWKKLYSFRNEYLVDLVANNLLIGIKAGLYRYDIDVDIIARLYTIRALDMLNHDLFPPKYFPTKKIFSQMFLYHIRGIASHKGLQYLEKEFTMVEPQNRLN